MSVIIFSDFCITGNSDLHNLKLEVRQSLKSAHAEGTRRNLQTQWKAFFLFCTYYSFTPLPCELETLCLYAQFLSRSFSSVDSIRNYLNGVKILHLFLDYSFNHFDTFYFKLFMKGLKRCNPHTIKAALPITPEILIQMKEFLDFDNVNSYTFWCLSLFAFFLMCRKSNLVGTVNDISKCLKRGDVTVFDDYLIVRFNWSKTIQFGERYLEIPIVANPASPLCAVSAFKKMCFKFPVSSDSPNFVITWINRNNKLIPVSYSLFQSFIKRSISNIGLNPDHYSSHSFRRGGATWAFKSEVSPDLIQLQGGLEE